MTTPRLSAPAVEVDQDVLESGFAEHDFPIHHNLATDPLFELEELAKLADSLPANQVEHNLGDLPEALPDGRPPQVDLPPGEIARGIETNGCWMVLKRIETDPRYAELLERTLADIIDRIAAREGGATRTEGYIVLSAPNSTTPVHIDPEHNVFIHVRGPKRFVVGLFNDHETKHAAMARYHGESHRYLDQMPDGATTYDLEPGDGLYLPPHTPHMVKTSDPVAISLSAAFYTRASENVVNLYSINSRIEKLGLPVAPPGKHSTNDRAKAFTWQTLRRGRGALKTLSRRTTS